MTELKNAASFVEDRQILRKLMFDDGYVFLKQVIPANAIKESAVEILSILQDHGWLTQNTKPSTKNFTMPPKHGPSGRQSHGEIGYEKATQSEWFQRIPYLDSIKQIVRTLISHEAFPIPSWASPSARFPFPPRGGVLRVVYPEKYVTFHNGMFEHQDYRILGVQDVFTIWLPLIPIPQNVGGLAVRPGAHKGGLLADRKPFSPSNEWATADYKVGDCIIFHALTPHAAMPNRSHQLRLSADFRIQSPETPLLRDFSHSVKNPPLRFLKTNWWEPIPKNVNFIDRDLFDPNLPLVASNFVSVPGFPDPIL